MSDASRFAREMELRGEIQGSGDLVIAGKVHGAVVMDGSVVIEPSGVVQGPVRARSLEVRGLLVGDVVAVESVVVAEGARVVGSLVSPRIRIVSGAAFRGRMTRESVDGTAAGEDRNRLLLTEEAPDPRDPSLHTAPPTAPCMPALQHAIGYRKPWST